MLTLKYIAVLSATIAVAIANAPNGVQVPERTFTHQGMTVTLQLEDANIPAQMHGYWGGGDGGRMKVIKSAMVGTKDGKYALYRSSFSDLADTHTIYSYVVKNDFVVLIEGGDASESYDAKLIFRKGLLFKRIVASGEFPNHHREETIYTNKDPGV